MTEEEKKERRKLYNKTYREKHREELKAKRRKKYAEDPEYREKVLESNRKWFKAHSEKKREYEAKYYQKNRERINEKKRMCFRQNPEPQRERVRAYRAENPEKIREMQKEYSKKYREKKLEAWTPSLDEKALAAKELGISYGMLTAQMQIGRISKKDLKKAIGTANRKAAIRRHYEERKRELRKGGPQNAEM